MHSTTLSENQTAYKHKHPLPAVKHSGEGLMIWDCFGPRRHAVIESTTNSSVYQSILV